MYDEEGSLFNNSVAYIKQFFVSFGVTGVMAA